MGDELNSMEFNQNAISKKQNIKNAFLLATLTDENDIKFVYTLVQNKNKVYFSCSSITKKQKLTKGWLPYMLEYEDATIRLHKSFINHKTYFEEVTDKYGTFRSIIMPRKTKTGIWYIIGADIEVSDINKKLNYMVIQYFILFFIFITILFIFLKLFNKIIKQENKDKLEQQKIILEQSKFAQMGEMIGNISHQYRQPLSEINSVVMQIESDFNNNRLNKEKLNNQLINIEDLTEYMSNTIDSFNNYLKHDKKTKEFLISTAINKGLDLTKNSMKENNINIKLTIIDDKNINSIEGEFIQVIVILLQNAKDILVLNNILNKTIKITLEIIDDKINISILDNADGVPTNILDKIFEPYFTTKFKSQGIGLGLYMAKNIIEKSMQGKLNVSNKENGAEFRIIL